MMDTALVYRIYGKDASLKNKPPRRGEREGFLCKPMVILSISAEGRDDVH